MTDVFRSADPTTEASPSGDELARLVEFAFECGQLKRLPRTGWLRAGVDRPESVAEHSLRTAMLAWLLAALEGVDAERAATLGLFHDVAEARATDVDYVGRRYLMVTPAEQIAADQTDGLPKALAAALRGLVAEHEQQSSPEADCAHDADRIEMLLQALEYGQQGRGNMETFVASALVGLRTQSGRRLAEAALQASPSAWWASFKRALAPGEGPPTHNGQ
jgi:putative hydrolases of HD superfamily